MRSLAAYLLAAALVAASATVGEAQVRVWWMGAGGDGGAAEQQAEQAQPAGPVAPDYDAWARLATAVEAQIEDPDTPSDRLEALRGELAEWRERFLSAQSVNRARIDTIRGQVAALGPSPGEGETEPPEIADRRRELSEQLSRLQAPGIAAEEAHRRADGLIREIDGILRAREADALLRTVPAPLNPANWPAAFRALRQLSVDLYAEGQSLVRDPDRRGVASRNAPLLLGALLLALFLSLRGRQWSQQVAQRLEEGAVSTRGRAIFALLVSLGQMLLPVVGVLAFCFVVLRAELVGPLGTALFAEGLPAAALTFFGMLWLGGQAFPRSDPADPLLVLPHERRAEGRIHVAFLATVLGLQLVAGSVLTADRYGPVGVSVVFFPALVLSGILLFRIGQLLVQASRNEIPEGETQGIRALLLQLAGKAAMILGALGPVLGAVGYVELGNRMVYPAVLTLGTLAFLLVLQRLVRDIHAVVFRARGAEVRDGLLPTLIGFALTLATLPVLALIWGARTADLREVWARFNEGLQLGETRIQPGDFVVFALIFAIGYGATRLVQGALRTSLLPKTSLDPGGRTAIVSGVGYVGIFLAALAAITSTGIDLSSLAIVAGALSVGIGFGLQNIVSNFVSGIILLIERPVSEGDWIEVGGVQGQVRSISVRSTRIETFDRTDVIVPNADLISERVTNYTGFNLTGRLILSVGVAYGTDTRKVERILREIAEAQPLVVLNPPPAVLFTGFGDSSLNFEVRMILRDVNFRLSVQSEVNHEIARRFAEEGIEIPFPQRDLWLRNARDLWIKPDEAPPAPPPEDPAPGSRLRGDELVSEGFAEGSGAAEPDR